MTNFPSFFTTAGLNVPADSKPLPLGPITGSVDSLVQTPNGTLNWAAELAATAARSNIVAMPGHLVQMENLDAFVML
jgi:hypothetical protein